jgi:Ca2+-binding RTX toxin-like protein
MNSPRFTCEGLETRRLLSAAIQVHDGTLIVRGTGHADNIAVSQIPPGGSIPLDAPANSLYVTINGRTRRLDSQKIRRVRVETGKGDDHVEMADDPFYTGTRVAIVTLLQDLPSTIVGGAGNDTLIGGQAADSLSGGAGNDLLGGFIGDDTLDGDLGRDTLAGNAGNDLLRGGNGHDRILADDTGDTVQGGSGFDLLLAPHGNPTTRSKIEATTDAATLDDLPNFGYAGGILTVNGTRRADDISFSAFTLSSPATITFGVNGRTVTGIDASSIKKVVVRAYAGDDNVHASVAGPNFPYSPNLGALIVPMQVDGDQGNDTILGGQGADTLNGGEDDDEIDGARGDDVINGGIGNDALYGSAGDDAIVGRDGDDVLHGGDGDDTVIGDAGNDQIFGDIGADTFESPTDNAAEWKDKEATDTIQPAPPSGILD